MRSEKELDSSPLFFAPMFHTGVIDHHTHRRHPPSDRICDRDPPDIMPSGHDREQEHRPQDADPEQDDDHRRQGLSRPADRSEERRVGKEC